MKLGLILLSLSSFSALADEALLSFAKTFQGKYRLDSPCPLPAIRKLQLGEDETAQLEIKVEDLVFGNSLVMTGGNSVMTTENINAFLSLTVTPENRRTLRKREAPPAKDRETDRATSDEKREGVLFPNVFPLNPRAAIAFERRLQLPETMRKPNGPSTIPDAVSVYANRRDDANKEPALKALAREKSFVDEPNGNVRVQKDDYFVSLVLLHAGNQLEIRVSPHEGSTSSCYFTRK